MRSPEWPPRQPLPLPDAEDLAIVRSPTLRASIAEVEAAVARIYQASSGYNPKVTISYTAQRYKQPLGVPFSTTVFGRPQTIQAAPFTLSQFEDELSLRQLISDGGHIRQRILQSVSAARATYGELLWRVDQMRSQVREAFIDILEAEALLGVEAEAERVAREHLKLAEASYKAGVTARADITFARTPVARAETILASARNSVQLAQANLNRLMGVDPTRTVAIAKEIPIDEPPGTLDDLRHLAQTGRPDLAARRDERDALAHAWDAAKRERAIKLEAVAGGRYVGYTTDEALPQHQGWSAGLYASYPLVDGGIINARIAEARALEQGAEARVDTLAREVDAQVVDAWLRLQTARERSKLSAAEVADAAEGMAVAEGQYKAGVNTILNVLDTQVAYTRARAGQVRADYDVKRALTRLNLAIGR